MKKGSITIEESNLYKVKSDIVFYIDDIFHITIPKWFIFDGASVPNIAKLVWIDDDDNIYCSCLHDYLYRKKAKIKIKWYLKNLIKYLYFVKFTTEEKYWYGKRRFADLAYKTALEKWEWIKESKRLKRWKIYASYIALRIFWGANFIKKELFDK